MSEETIREAGPFKFINRTRYNGEDLASLFNLTREWLKRELKDPNAEPRRNKYQPPVEVFDINDFNPGNVFTYRGEWNEITKRTTQVLRPTYISGPGSAASTSWKLGIVPPHRLYANEVEMLTAATENLAPPELSRQVAVMFRDLFPDSDLDYDSSKRRSEWIDAEALNIRVRIMPERENPASSGDRKLRVVRTRVANNVARLAYDVGDVRHRMQAIDHLSRGMQGDFVKAQLSPTFSHTEIAELLEKVRDLTDRIESYKAELLA